MTASPPDARTGPAGAPATTSATSTRMTAGTLRRRRIELAGRSRLIGIARPPLPRVAQDRDTTFERALRPPRLGAQRWFGAPPCRYDLRHIGCGDAGPQ